jgi:hypothetical protein
MPRRRRYEHFLGRVAQLGSKFCQQRHPYLSVYQGKNPFANSRDASDLYKARGQFDTEQHHEAAESLASPILDLEEVRRRDLLPVLDEKLFPGRFPNSFRCGFDALRFRMLAIVPCHSSWPRFDSAPWIRT